MVSTRYVKAYRDYSLCLSPQTTRDAHYLIVIDYTNNLVMSLTTPPWAIRCFNRSPFIILIIGGRRRNRTPAVFQRPPIFKTGPPSNRRVTFLILLFFYLWQFYYQLPLPSQPPHINLVVKAGSAPATPCSSGRCSTN